MPASPRQIWLWANYPEYPHALDWWPILLHDARLPAPLAVGVITGMLGSAALLLHVPQDWLLLASGVCYVVRQGPAFIQQTKALTLQPGTAVACLLLAVLIGTVSALVPAWQASRTTIVDALKDIG